MQGGYNTGKDVSIDINGPSGPIRIPKLMDFDSKPKITSTEITPLNGLTDELNIPKGWTGTFTAERTDATLDNYWAQWEADYYAGVNQPASSITETISEPDGSTSTFRYTNVQLKLDDAGKKEGDKTIKQTMSFTARRRLKVS
ncbi:MULTISPECIES: hypothetical protein [unclassified Pseudomonas]|uniref:hypothetical protein n=1 Tax=unclassified Pseudomonas TaxID=196821 RepID=UPI002B23CFA3|nr:MULTISPECIES: hypothetical protein [unclassified Pseudomonas]MEB0133605.1 hypothetical protein [Pseudomonas sp. CCI2.4]MEB0167955.1 hypothetical protein [Pseudomonas sp. CCC4.4]